MIAIVTLLVAVPLGYLVRSPVAAYVAYGWHSRTSARCRPSPCSRSGAQVATTPSTGTEALLSTTCW